MIQMRSVLDIADNTGARKASCIGLVGRADKEMAEIGDIIRRLIDEIGLSVLLVEQKLPFARRVGDNFVILDRGRGVATGAMPELNDELIKQYLTV